MLRAMLCLTFIAAFLSLSCPAPACNLCPKSGTPLRQDMDKAKLVVYGTLVNAQANARTDLHIVEVLKHDAFLGDKKILAWPRYDPTLDPKDPPKVLVFSPLSEGKFDTYRVQIVRSPVMLDYLKGAKAHQGKENTHFLRYAFDYLDHRDERVAAEAFLEFARATDREVGQAASHFAPDKPRGPLQNPDTPTERLGLCAFLLAASSNDKEKDAALLRALIDQPTYRTRNALDGLLAGYIHLQPRQGWDLAADILADGKKSYAERFAVVRMLRFLHGWRPEETKQNVLRCQRVILDNSSMADLAIEDLRKWQMWDLTDQVLSLYGNDKQMTLFVRASIIRYVLQCPRPEARRFADDLRRRQPELIRDQEERLEDEKSN